MEIGANLSERGKRDFLLIQLALKGDESAFKKLHKLYKRTIYFNILKLVGNIEQAEDLTMETFEKAFLNLHQYQPDNAFSTWLYKIAKNNAIDYLRKKREYLVSINTKNDEADLEFEGNIKDPEQQLIREQLKKSIRIHISSLKPKYQQIINLRYFGNYSYQEISEELQIPIGTVKVLISRAKDQLYQLITEQNK